MEHNDWPKRVIHAACEVLELAAAGLVIIGLILAVIGLITDGALFRNVLAGEHAFLVYLERVFAIVIGIEFLEMLCQPTPENVIQTLIFLVARHMIVGEATPLENFVSILSIVVLFALKRWLQASEPGEGNGVLPEGIRRILSKGKKESSDKAE